MRTYNAQYVKEVKKLIPEAKWVAVNEDGSICWYYYKPKKLYSMFSIIHFGGYLGQIKYSGDWRKSLRRVR